MNRVHLFIFGQVQGVFFRAYTEEKARELGLAGWVKNLADSRVEMIIEGKEDDLKKMIGWCRQGPPGAKVEKMTAQWGKAEGSKGFEIRY